MLLASMRSKRARKLKSKWQTNRAMWVETQMRLMWSEAQSSRNDWPHF